MFFKITYTDSYGLHQVLIGADSKEEAIGYLKEDTIENYTIKHIYQLKGKGLISSFTVIAEKKLTKRAGHFSPEQRENCGECGCEIGDYVSYRGFNRCIGCWVEYDSNTLNYFGFTIPFEKDEESNKDDDLEKRGK